MKRTGTNPAAIQARERQNQALAMRKEGRSLAEIAAALGYAGESGAHAAIVAALNRIEPVANDVRKLELDRLDSLFAVVYPAALGGCPDSLASCLKIVEARARLLGLNRRDCPVTLPGLPKLKSAADALALVGALVERAAAGDLSPDEAGRLAGLVGQFVKVTETVELEARVAALEERA